MPKEKILVIGLDNTFDNRMKREYNYLINKQIEAYDINEDGNYLIQDPLYPHHQWTIHYADVISVSQLKEN